MASLQAYPKHLYTNLLPGTLKRPAGTHYVDENKCGWVWPIDHMTWAHPVCVLNSLGAESATPSVACKTVQPS